MLKVKKIDQQIRGALLILNNPDSDDVTLLKKFISVHAHDLPKEVVSLLKKSLLPLMNNPKGTIKMFYRKRVA